MNQSAAQAGLQSLAADSVRNVLQIFTNLVTRGVASSTIVKGADWEQYIISGLCCGQYQCEPSPLAPLRLLNVIHSLPRHIGNVVRHT